MPRADLITGLYDILGHLVPGIVALWTARLIANAILELSIVSEWPSGTFEVTSLLLFALVAGLLLQAIGRRAENTIINRRFRSEGDKRNRFPSTHFLLDDNDHYSKELRALFYRNAERVFDGHVPKNEVFDLAYAYLVVNGTAKHAEIFNARYGMLRGLLIASFSASLAYLLLSFKLFFEARPVSELLEPAVLSSALATAGILSIHQARSYSVRFADSVFHGFIACTSIPPKKGAQ